MFATPKLRLQVCTTADGRIGKLGAPDAPGLLIIALVFRGPASFESFVQLLVDNIQVCAAKLESICMWMVARNEVHVFFPMSAGESLGGRCPTPN